jgi:hypothetical protein
MTEQFHKGKNRRKRSDVHGALHHGWPVCVPNQGMRLAFEGWATKAEKLSWAAYTASITD